MRTKMMMAQLSIQQKAARLMSRARQAVMNRRGEGFVDTAGASVRA